MFGDIDEIFYTVDLSRPLRRDELKPLFFTEDNAGTTISLAFVNGAGSAFNVSTYTAEMNFIRPDGVTVLIPGVIANDVASFTILAACLEVSGGAEAHVSLNSGQSRKTVWSADAVIHRSNTDSYADPSNIIPSISALLAQYDACVAATENANNAVASATVAIAAMNAELENLKSVIDQAQAASHTYVQATTPEYPEEGDLWLVTAAQTWGDVDDGTWADAATGTWRDLASPTVSDLKVYVMGNWTVLP